MHAARLGQRVIAHSGIIGNEGADACAHTAALMDATDIALLDAWDPIHNFFWLSMKSLHGRNGDPHHSHTAPTHYLNNLTDKLETHRRHKLSSADTSGYYYISWQRLNYAIQPTPPNTTANVNAHNPPFQLANKEISNSFWDNSKITLKTTDK
eukprot:1161134-Pelagomonas_calceolata.AAC.1